MPARLGRPSSDSAGGRTQVASLAAVVAVIVVLAVAAGVLKDLPEAALGAVLMFVASKLFHLHVLRSILRFNVVEFALAVITLAVVVFVGIEQGVVTAAILALAQRTRLAARPRDAVLGREPGTDHWIQTDADRPTEEVPGVVVYLLYAPVWYGNAAHVVDRIRQVIKDAPQPVHTLVLDGDAIPDIDYTGAEALAELLSRLEKEGVHVGVARASAIAHRDLRRSGLLDAIGTDRVFTQRERRRPHALSAALAWHRPAKPGHRPSKPGPPIQTQAPSSQKTAPERAPGPDRGPGTVPAPEYQPHRLARGLRVGQCWVDADSRDNRHHRTRRLVPG